MIGKTRNTNKTLGYQCLFYVNTAQTYIREATNFTVASISDLQRQKHRISDPRDSGLIEDYSEPTEAHVSKSQRTSQILANHDASLNGTQENTSVSRDLGGCVVLDFPLAK